VSDKEIIGLSRLIVLRQQLDSVARNVANQTTRVQSEPPWLSEYLTQAKEEVPCPGDHSLRRRSLSDFSRANSNRQEILWTSQS
jgi:flagellar basal-body rod protein FlgF